MVIFQKKKKIDSLYLFLPSSPLLGGFRTSFLWSLSSLAISLHYLHGVTGILKLFPLSLHVFSFSVLSSSFMSLTSPVDSAEFS